jgi:LysR family transcriptional regulator, hydrogen peroxide-inducible genes activator
MALTETLNFTRAAERCNVTQPSLTRAIKQLEDELGGPLFHRERANTHLTELGRTMRPFLAQIAENMQAAKARAQDMVRLKRATLDVGLMCTIGPTKLIDLISGFRQRYPDVELRLRDGNGTMLQEALVGGSLDIALLDLPGGLDERLNPMPLFAESFMITFAPGHHFAGLTEVGARDLDQAPYISRANCEFGAHVSKLLRERGVIVNPLYRSEREDWVLAMILAGLGWGFTPQCAVSLPGIEARPLVDPVVDRTIKLATVRGRPHSPAVGAFVREAVSWRARGCPDGLAAAGAAGPRPAAVA